MSSFHRICHFSAFGTLIACRCCSELYEAEVAQGTSLPVWDSGSWVWSGVLSVTFPTSLLSTLFGGWVLPRLGEASRVEGNGICSASELTFDSEFEASVQPVVLDDTESECSVAVSSLVWLRTVDWSLPIPNELSGPSAPRLKWGWSRES